MNSFMQTSIYMLDRVKDIENGNVLRRPFDHVTRRQHWDEARSVASLRAVDCRVVERLSPNCKTLGSLLQRAASHLI